MNWHPRLQPLADTLINSSEGNSMQSFGKMKWRLEKNEENCEEHDQLLQVAN
jgi:hypothetical protein